MGRWDEMSEYVYAIDSGAAPTSSANAFLRAVLDVHRQDYRRARGGLFSSLPMNLARCWINTLVHLAIVSSMLCLLQHLEQRH